jgi:hypothetical protein
MQLFVKHISQSAGATTVVGITRWKPDGSFAKTCALSLGQLYGGVEKVKVLLAALRSITSLRSVP